MSTVAARFKKRVRELNLTVPVLAVEPAEIIRVRLHSA